MSVKNNIQEAITSAMRAKDMPRLECLRMAKGAMLLKEKAGPKDQELSDADAVAAVRSEIEKRQQSIEIFRQHGRETEAKAAEYEITVLEEFLPKQLSAAEVETRVRAYLAEHPDLNHAGKLTGAMKKELGDQVDGKILNDVCRAVLT